MNTYTCISSHIYYNVVIYKLASAYSIYVEIINYKYMLFLFGSILYILNTEKEKLVYLMLGKK